MKKNIHVLFFVWKIVRKVVWTMFVIGGFFFYWDLFQEGPAITHEQESINLADYRLEIERSFYSDHADVVIRITPYMCEEKRFDDPCSFIGPGMNSFALAVPFRIFDNKNFSKEEIVGESL